MRAHVALHAPDRIFVHAGRRRAPRPRARPAGAELLGKTTLVAALVRAGATYYSDEFAPLDADGLVHPYAQPLSLRDGRVVAQPAGGRRRWAASPASAARRGRRDRRDELRAAARNGTRARSTPGESVIALLSNTVAAQDASAPDDALSAAGGRRCHGASQPARRGRRGRRRRCSHCSRPSGQPPTTARRAPSAASRRAGRAPAGPARRRRRGRRRGAR